jgi:hypothetical protein
MGELDNDQTFPINSKILHNYISSKTDFIGSLFNGGVGEGVVGAAFGSVEENRTRGDVGER